MEHFIETSVDAKLRALIWYLVTAFPQAAILSRQPEEGYYFFLIVPYGGGPEKAIRVERAWLGERNPSLEDFACLLERLNLPPLLEERDRYDLNHTTWPFPISERTTQHSSCLQACIGVYSFHRM